MILNYITAVIHIQYVVFSFSYTQIVKMAKLKGYTQGLILYKSAPMTKREDVYLSTVYR